MPTGRGVRAVDAWAALIRLQANLVPKLDARMRAESGMSLAWYDVLLELAAEPGGRLRMVDLAERVVLSRTRISRLVDELVDAGLVVREPNDDDGRSWYAAITDDGRTRQRSAGPLYVRHIASLIGSALSSDELQTLTALLHRLLTAAES